jgi:membrane-bound lytic murein transglycosylase B
MWMNRRAARVALLYALLCAACACAATAAMRPPAGFEAEEAAAAARAALARLPAETRLGEIKNERLRRAVQATYRAVVELADNRESGKVAALNAKFERAYVSVGRETARGEHKTCAANCKAFDGEPCLLKCKSTGTKFCGCKLILFGCVVAECVF